uniref:Uncharacterized protein n=1 Tax=Helianthus annuus TaxID=4232 RepID=A0A251UL89_HELAN
MIPNPFDYGLNKDIWCKSRLQGIVWPRCLGYAQKNGYMLPLIFTMTRVEVGRVNRSHMVEPLVSILLMRLSRSS